MTITERKAHDAALTQAIGIIREAAVHTSDINTRVWTSLVNAGKHLLAQKLGGVTVAELRAHLATLPDDVEVLVERGEWGPCVLGALPRVALCDMRNGRDMLWEMLDGGEPEDYQEPQGVVLI